MKNAVCIFAALSGLLLTCVPAKAVTRVYLLAGQSNMEGLGNVGDTATPANYVNPLPAVNFWSINNQWVPLQEGLAAPEIRTTNQGFGPELSFGYQIHATDPTDDVYLIKYAEGATSLAGDWNPTAPGENRYDAGWCYQGLISTADAALANLRAAGRTPVISGLLWMQGEADAATETNAANYQTNLVNFIGQVRSHLSAPTMPVVIGRITNYFGPYNSTVRAAEQAVAASVTNTAWINTDDLEMNPSYGGHYGTQGQIDLGIRFATAIGPMQTPEPSAFVLLTIGGLTLLGYLWKKRK